MCGGGVKREKNLAAAASKKQEDGRLLFQADYTDKENLITWLMSFRDKVELLEPEEVRAKIRESIENMKRKYDE